MNSEEAVSALLTIDRIGPNPEAYEQVDEIFKSLDSGNVRLSNLDHISDRTLDSFRSIESMHGHVCLKPHGYHGDFEIIDRIYSHHTSSFKGWDDYFHQGTAAVAVRGRKKYFLEKFSEIFTATPQLKMLNIASGPCRDLLELSKRVDITKAAIHCVDVDQNAIEHASKLLAEFSNITFEKKNVLRYKPNKPYDVIWCAGLFDYLDKKFASFLAKNFLRWLAPGGQAIFGNFSYNNTQRFYMQFGGWELIHRDEDDLFALCENGENHSISVESEESGTNLFCVVKH